jgi:hypothetical protein
MGRRSVGAVAYASIEMLEKLVVGERKGNCAVWKSGGYTHSLKRELQTYQEPLYKRALRIGIVRG